MSHNKCCRGVSRKTTAVSDGGGTIYLEVEKVPSPVISGQRLMLCIAQNIPTPTIDNPSIVSIMTNGNPVGLYTSRGEPVYSDQLISKRTYSLAFSTSLVAWVVGNSELCCTNHLFDPVELSTPTPEIKGGN